MDANPTGCYRTTFALPAAWRAAAAGAGESLFLRFDAVDSACYVWLNGRLLGFSQARALMADD